MEWKLHCRIEAECKDVPAKCNEQGQQIPVGYEWRTDLYGRVYVREAKQINLPHTDIRPLKFTKWNLARALYCINKYAKQSNCIGNRRDLYAIKDKILGQLLRLQHAHIQEYHHSTRTRWVEDQYPMHDDEDDEEPAGWEEQDTRYYEVIAFSKFTFHRPCDWRFKPKESKNITGEKFDSRIIKTKPLTEERAKDLLTRWFDVICPLYSAPQDGFFSRTRLSKMGLIIHGSTAPSARFKSENEVVNLFTKEQAKPLVVA